MSLLFKNIIIYNFIEKEFGNDRVLIINYCLIEQKLINAKNILFLDVLNKNKNLNISLKNLNFFCFSKYYKSIMNDIIISSKSKNTNIITFDVFVLYSIIISFVQKNVIIHVIDTKGFLIVSCSTNSSLKLSITKRQRIQPKMISNLINYFLDQILYFKDEVSRVPVALQLKNVNKNNFNLIIKKLKSKFDIKIINYFNCNTHNGCRPRKLRRIKQRKRKR